MAQIHFTVADLSRIRLKVTLGPVAEMVFALGLLDRAVSPPQLNWRRTVLAGVAGRPDLSRLLALSRRQLGGADDLLWLVDESRQADRATLNTLDLTEATLTAAMIEIWQVAVAPYWGRMFGYLDAECGVRGRIAMAGGVEHLLATLHSKVRWNPPVLEIPGPDASDVHLDGRGLLLCPSLFLAHRPAVLIGSQLRSGLPALVFAVPPDAAGSASLWQGSDDTVAALGTLVGKTRAAALRVLTAACTTSQLAERLGISVAGASQHAAVLRKSGLITTRRIRNTVWHTVTPLGMALLSGQSWQAGNQQHRARRRAGLALAGQRSGQLR